MAHEPQKQVRPTTANKPGVFLGFQPPTSNVTGTPNQLFDVLMPLCSGPAFKVLSYMIRRTLGWTDAFGNPQEEQLAIPHSQIIAKAGVSSAHVRRALDELLSLRAIECLREPQPPAKGKPPVVGLYQLKWDSRPEYITDPKHFQGFFDGDGNFTYIPNQYFDEIVPSENFSLTKTVGVIARYSIGYKSQRGTRRRFTRASLSFIKDRANINRTTVADILRAGVEKNYLIRFSEGVYGYDKATQVAATYGLKWLDKEGLDYSLHSDDPLGVPSKSDQVPSKTDQGEDAFQNRLDTFENRPEEHLPNPTRDASQNRPEKHLPKPSNIKTLIKKTSLKQQRADTVGRAVAVSELASLLTEQGLSAKDAVTIALEYPEEVIRQQVEWLPLRNPKNPAGMLRQAIREEWEAPVPETYAPPDSPASAFVAGFYAGYAGNEGDALAAPSKAEISLANPYIEKILTLWPDGPSPEDHGRALGRHVRENKPPKADFRPNFSTALRMFGDEFYTRLNGKRAAELAAQREELWTRRWEQHRAAYYASILGQEARLEAEHPKRYADFVAARAEDRRRIERNRFIREEAERQRNLRHHDSDEAKVQAMLDKNYPSNLSDLVYDFPRWYRQTNPAGAGDRGNP